mgnify:CR=1 FL=1
MYKIDPTLTPPNQWIELDYTTTSNTVTCAMTVGAPPIVFASPAAPPPLPVGGEIYPLNKVAVLAPWLALLAAIIAGATILLRRRRAQG